MQSPWIFSVVLFAVSMYMNAMARPHQKAKYIHVFIRYNHCLKVADVRPTCVIRQPFSRNHTRRSRIYSSRASIGCSTSRRTPRRDSAEAPRPCEDSGLSAASPLLSLVLALRICIIVLTPEKRVRSVSREKTRSLSRCRDNSQRGRNSSKTQKMMQHPWKQRSCFNDLMVHRHCWPLENSVLRIHLPKRVNERLAHPPLLFDWSKSGGHPSTKNMEKTTTTLKNEVRTN